MKDRHAAEFGSDDMEVGEGSAVCGIAKRKAAAALWIPSAQKLYLAVREKTF